MATEDAGVVAVRRGTDAGRPGQGGVRRWRGRAAAGWATGVGRSGQGDVAMGWRSGQVGVGS